MRKLFFAVLVLPFLNCGSPTSSDLASYRIRSALGFTIQAHKEYRDPGEGVTQAHADLADQYWQELMVCLQKEMGYGEGGRTGANPNSLPSSYVTIMLLQPREFKDYPGQELVSCNGRPNGACYSNETNTIKVPGNYPTTTRKSYPGQPLKHEMLHYWYYKTRSKNGLTGNSHFKKAPNGSGKNIWWCTDRPYDNLSVIDRSSQYNIVYFQDEVR